MQETGRLRERASKKERDRERLSRNKRRRGDRMMHGSNREEGADTSDGSLDEDDDEEEEEAPNVRLPPSAPSMPASSSSLPPSNHLRKSFPAKVVRAPAVWKADEMIGVPIPRKARSGEESTSRKEFLQISLNSSLQPRLHILIPSVCEFFLQGPRKDHMTAGLLVEAAAEEQVEKRVTGSRRRPHQRGHRIRRRVRCLRRHQMHLFGRRLSVSSLIRPSSIFSTLFSVFGF